MNRVDALAMVKNNVDNENLIKHMLATEAVMRALASKLGEDEEKWALAGLLHDVDYEATAKSPKTHGLIAGQMLKDAGLADDIVHAVMAHNSDNGTVCENLFDKALYAADPVYGLITACTLVKPSRKVADVKLKSVKKKFKDKAFARSVNRAQIDSCTELGLERSEFLEITIAAMVNISDDLGL